MARVTHVKKAQQRYAQVPVLNEDGTPKRTPVMRNGVQRVTKRGKPIFLSVTADDKTRPLPNYTCDRCKVEIKPGDPYKHISPKSGPYGGRTLRRCAACPTWNVWEYSSSLSARIAQIQNGVVIPEDANEVDDYTSVASEIAEQIRELASEKEEGADNIESGFGHETSQSAELREIAESLNGWADDLENVSIDDLPEPEEEDCDDCDGKGYTAEDCSACSGSGVVECGDCGGSGENESEGGECEECSGSGEVECADCSGEGEDRTDCETCSGSGQVTPDEPTEEQMNDWREAASAALQDVLDSCPV